MAPFPRDNQPATWWQVYYIGLLPSWVGWGGAVRDDNMYWTIHLFYIQICLPCMQCFCQNYHLRSYRIPYLLLQHFRNQGTLFMANEIQQWAIVHGVNRILHVHNISDLPAKFLISFPMTLCSTAFRS